MGLGAVQFGILHILCFVAWVHVDAQHIKQVFLTVQSRHDPFLLQNQALEVTVQLNYSHYPQIRVFTKSIQCPMLLDGNMVYLELDRYNQMQQVQQLETFCQRYQLIPLYCDTIRNETQAHLQYVNNNAQNGTLWICMKLQSVYISVFTYKCIVQDYMKICGSEVEGYPENTAQRCFTIESSASTTTFSLETMLLEPHKYQVTVWTESNMRRISEKVSTTVQIVPSWCTKDQLVEVVYPRHGQLVPLQTIIQFQIHPCRCVNFFCYLIFHQTDKVTCKPCDELPQIVADVVTFTYAGRIRLWSWYTTTVQEYQQQEQKLHSLITVQLLQRIQSKNCLTIREFQADGTMPALRAVDMVPTTTVTKQHDPMIILTAATQYYFDTFRLQNLVGSIQYWEPYAQIHIVGLNLSLETKSIIQKWTNVFLLDFETIRPEYPAHVYQYKATYAFKPLIIDLYAKQYDQVLWLDANMELRQPLDSIRQYLRGQGHFFTIQGADFPLSFNSKQTLHALNCTKDKYQHQQQRRPVCASGIQGYTRHGFAARVILPLMVQCAYNESCFAPRDGRYYDQTVLNAVMCGLEVLPCEVDYKYWISSSIDDQSKTFLQITTDATDWNDVVIYTRREEANKPYLIYLK